ncbi:hypothetical protein NUW58_g4991 [Xylaria curta]|nr:hypothetical protein NUW58_g4991 [Xylaria curta]
MGPVLAKRRQLKAAALAEGRTLDFNDAIDWFERNSKGEKYDPVAIQLTLSMVAIHTTTDLVTQVMLDLTFNPEILESLRSEINTLICKEGWKKTTLYNMKLLDSVIKESQRMKPIQMASLFRKATAGFELSDGTKIRKGERVVVSSHSMWDPKVYDNPERWHGDRFYRMRDSPGKAHLAQLVSTSPQHLGFGHGQHACPGRFFAANEIKIALVFILSQYEWKLPVGAQPEVMKWGFNTSADPFMKVEIRRRPEQFDLPLPLDRQSPADDATTIA